MQLNQCQLEPHEPLVILVEYDMCSSCYFTTPQDMLMMVIGMRTIAMSNRFEVNQSTFAPMWSFRRERYLFLLSLLYNDYVIYYRSAM